MSKQPKKITKDGLISTGGIVLFLFAVLLLLSCRTRLRYVAYPLHFLFGSVGFWFVSVLFMIGGLHLLFHKVWKKYSFRVNFGILISLLAGWLLIAEILANGVFNDESGAFFTALNDAYSGNGIALYIGSEIAGGYLGNIILAALNKAGIWLPYLILIPFLLLGLFLVFFPFIKRFFRFAHAESAVKKARREKVREKREEDEREYVFEAGEPEPKREAPKLSFAPKEETPETPAPTSPMGEYVFAPAGGSTLPSRKSLRVEHARSPMPASPRFEQSSYASTSPRELENPKFDSYANNPVRTSGLKEAFFDPGPMESAVKEPSPDFHVEQVAKVAQEKPTPEATKESPHLVAAPSFLTSTNIAKPSPAEPTAIPQETPAQPAPAFTDEPIHMPDFEKEEEEAEFFEAQTTDAPVEEEEDDHPFEAVNNDPIVLAPKDALILTPETLAPEETLPPKPEPTPETKEEPKPEDDDIEKPLPPYVFPSADLLDEGNASTESETIKEECRKKAEAINQIFVDFRVGAHVTEYLVGPSITRYSIEADPGVSVQAIARIIPDLEVRLGGVPVRFVERVLGLACSALEVANDTRRIVSFKEMFVALPPRRETADLRIPFGLAIDGSLKQADLAKFPHMLVAGTSGSGKSVFAHGILMTLIMRNRPEDLKLVLIDPKRGVEMAPYKDMPHLLCPIVKEAIPAKNALAKLCKLMDERYVMLAEAGVSNISDYNAEYALPNHKKRMSYIVVFVDEFADLVGECKEISDHVLRIAQKARACGIHLIVATQRPDVKVITGTIKSNLLCRVALTVASSQDSVTILGQGGAEDLYGYGDMLIDCQELSKRDFVRAQGCLATHREMKNVCDFVRNQMAPMYDPDFLNLEDEDEDKGPEIRDGGYAPVPTLSSAELKKISDDEKYNYVKSVIMTREYCSISMIQREFEVGFPRAGKILSRLQQEGIVAAPDGTANNSKGCRVLVHDESELPQQNS